VSVRATCETVDVTLSGGIMMAKLLAEAIGTFWLVFGGCGSAVLAAAYPELGIGFVGVSLAFGLTVLTMAAAIGHVSGCHLNPAVTAGLVAGGRFPLKDAAGYVVAQVIGGIAGAGTLYLIAEGLPGFDAVASGFASNGYGDHSPVAALGGGGYPWQSCFIIEAVLTAVFLFVIHGATDAKSPGVIAPIAIGLCLTLIHLVSIPVTNTSVNPARSTATALFTERWAIEQLWLFWLAPILGGIAGGRLYRVVSECHEA
jgi:aquaporin Z